MKINRYIDVKMMTSVALGVVAATVVVAPIWNMTVGRVLSAYTA